MHDFIFFLFLLEQQRKFCVWKVWKHLCVIKKDIHGIHCEHKREYFQYILYERKKLYEWIKRHTYVCVWVDYKHIIVSLFVYVCMLIFVMLLLIFPDYFIHTACSMYGKKRHTTRKNSLDFSLCLFALSFHHICLLFALLLLVLFDCNNIFILSYVCMKIIFWLQYHVSVCWCMFADAAAALHPPPSC
jgi:hypothetical protein